MWCIRNLALDLSVMTLTYQQILPSVLDPVAPGMGDRNVSFLREEFVTFDPEF